jgi:hypothetical protein
MPVALSCSCGARFDVEDSFAGQELLCPQCQNPLPVPAHLRRAARTSGYAIASVILALVGAFTLIGTLVAVLCGLGALVSIRRRKDELAGRGLALFGIVAGTLLTGLTVFALSGVEVFGFMDDVRARLQADYVDRSGPLEISRPTDGFVITRPSYLWGLAGASLRQKSGGSSFFLLADPSRGAFIDVQPARPGAQSWQAYQDGVIDAYAHSRTGLRVRDRRRLPAAGNVEANEVQIEYTTHGGSFTHLVRFYRVGPRGAAFVVTGWAPLRRFPRVEADIRKGLDSFRILGN